MAMSDVIIRHATSLSSLLTFITASGLILTLYCVWLAISRLYLSPIAKFPGPKLAALTLWYEFYYDVYLGGQYVYKLEELHAQHGPIVRINPYELHVIDSDFYEVLYSGGSTRRDKWEWVYNQFATLKSGFGTSSHELHRMRRAVVNPYFSKRSIVKLEPMIKEKVEALCARFRKAALEKTPVNLGYAFGALTLDVITEYCYGFHYDTINKPDFDPMWLNAVTDLSKNGHFLKHFDFMVPLMKSLPDSLVVKLNPLTANMLKMHSDVRAVVTSLMENGSKKDSGNQETIFQALLHNDLPPEQKELQRIVEEAAVIVGAGQLTTADTLACIFYYLCLNPLKLRKLQEELGGVMTNPHSLPRCQQLEQLPYLTAVILEGLRITIPVTARLPRIAPDESLRFQEWIIPKGTPVSMSAYFVHRDERYFPNPDEFQPERWVNPQDRIRLERYLVAFSKGSRICLGMTLAWEEMYLAVAAIARQFELELYETTSKDVQMTKDMFNPHTDAGIRKIQVLVR